MKGSLEEPTITPITLNARPGRCALPRPSLKEDSVFAMNLGLNAKRKRFEVGFAAFWGAGWESKKDLGFRV